MRIWKNMIFDVYESMLTLKKQVPNIINLIFPYKERTEVHL